MQHLRIHLLPVVSSLSDPLFVTNAGDGSGRLFVVEQTGRVRIVRGNTLAGTPYLDLHTKIASGGEQGLLSIAFHPHFAKHPRVYAAYTRSNGDLVVASFRPKKASANRVPVSTERRLLIVPHHRAGNHNGGQILFGKDGYLYITTGDGGSEGDPFGLADKRTNLTGKILRIDVNHSCGSHHYCIPASNPYKHSKKFRHEVLDWGLRNPWRTSIDAKTGTLWIGEVGQDNFEEVDHVGTRRSFDFGWSCKEARSTYKSSNCSGRHLTGPVAVYSHRDGSCAIIGGYVYRGSKYASIARGVYVFADYCSGVIRGTVHKSGGGYSTAQIGSLGGSFTGFGVSQRKELYVVTQAGNLYRATFTKS